MQRWRSPSITGNRFIGHRFTGHRFTVPSVWTIDYMFKLMERWNGDRCTVTGSDRWPLQTGDRWNGDRWNGDRYNGDRFRPVTGSDRWPMKRWPVDRLPIGTVKRWLTVTVASLSPSGICEKINLMEILIWSFILGSFVFKKHFILLAPDFHSPNIFFAKIIFSHMTEGDQG